MYVHMYICRRGVKGWKGRTERRWMDGLVWDPLYSTAMHGGCIIIILWLSTSRAPTSSKLHILYTTKYISTECSVQDSTVPGV